jgi:hypothetical protein
VVCEFVILGQHCLLKRDGVGAVMGMAMVVVLLTVVVLGLTLVCVVVLMIEAVLLIVIMGMAVGQQADLHLVGPAPTRCTHN